MGKRTVIWTKRAEEELKSVLEYYIQRNQSNRYSLKLIDQVEKITRLVSSFPYLGRISDNGKTRVIVKDKFLIFYEVYTNKIAIVSFWNNRQDPKRRIDA